MEKLKQLAPEQFSRSWENEAAPLFANLKKGIYAEHRGNLFRDTVAELIKFEISLSPEERPLFVLRVAEEYRDRSTDKKTESGKTEQRLEQMSFIFSVMTKLTLEKKESV